MKKLSKSQRNRFVVYCQKCNMAFCNKCKQYHSELFKSHTEDYLDKDFTNLLSKYCRDENHNVEFQYFCKTRNQLCCN